MADNSLRKIVQSKMPGWDLVEGTSRARDSVDAGGLTADQVGVDVAALRRKYLKPKADKAADAAPATASSEAGDAAAGVSSHKMRLARVRSNRTPVDSPVGSMAVLVDVTGKKIVGKQG